jgi:hypothetical protein
MDTGKNIASTKVRDHRYLQLGDFTCGISCLDLTVVVQWIGGRQICSTYCHCDLASTHLLERSRVRSHPGCCCGVCCCECRQCITLYVRALWAHSRRTTITSSCRFMAREVGSSPRCSYRRRSRVNLRSTCSTLLLHSIARAKCQMLRVELNVYCPNAIMVVRCAHDGRH